MNCRHPGCSARVGPMSLTGYCYFHANDVTRDEHGRFKSWGVARLFKAGAIKIDLKGYEVDADWAKVLAADPELKKAILEDFR